MSIGHGVSYGLSVGPSTVFSIVPPTPEDPLRFALIYTQNNTEAHGSVSVKVYCGDSMIHDDEIYLGTFMSNGIPYHIALRKY